MLDGRRAAIAHNPTLVESPTFPWGRPRSPRPIPLRREGLALRPKRSTLLRWAARGPARVRALRIRLRRRAPRHRAGARRHRGSRGRPTPAPGGIATRLQGWPPSVRGGGGGRAPGTWRSSPPWSRPTGAGRSSRRCAAAPAPAEGCVAASVPGGAPPELVAASVGGQAARPLSSSRQRARRAP